MSDMRWEPIEDHEELVGMGFDAIFGPRPDGTLTLFVEVPNDAGAGELTLPPDVRLCRAKPVTWSQEPPEWGQAWFRGVIHPDDEVETGRYYHFDDDDPAMLFVVLGEVYWSKDDDAGMDAICSVSDCCGEWLPVPQPPTGEVGP